jgi:hypothetical protein
LALYLQLCFCSSTLLIQKTIKKMKKAILTVAMLAVVLVSCQDKTKEKLDEAKDAVSTEVEQKVDSITEKAEDAIDTTKAKAGEALEKGAKKMEEAGKELKESSKK